MNKVQLLGRLTKDVEVKETATGRKMARFTLACHQGKDKEGNPLTHFIPCGAWERRAEVIAQYFKKGHRMLVTGGELIVAKYVDSESQEQRSFIYVLVNDFEFVETKRETAALEAAQQGTKGETKIAAPFGSSYDVMGEDIFCNVDF